ISLQRNCRKRPRIQRPIDNQANGHQEERICGRKRIGFTTALNTLVGLIQGSLFLLRLRSKPINTTSVGTLFPRRGQGAAQSTKSGSLGPTSLCPVRRGTA